jgi:RNA polymerase sigma factor (TIGR02999 family)
VGQAPGDITLLLRRWTEGDDAAARDLMPLVYPHLKEVAAAYLRRESAGHTLQPTALVNELYLRFLQERKAEWKDRSHFYAFAAKRMRWILSDYGRNSHAKKRGGSALHLPLNDEIPWVNVNSLDIIELNRALDELELVDPRKVRLVELRYFLGCTLAETAELLGISVSTIERDLDLARAWLYGKLRGSREANAPGTPA